MPATKSTTRSSAMRSKRLSTRPKARSSTSSPSTRLKRTPSLKLRTILVPVDFSKRSRAALNYAITLARDYGGSLLVLHVLDQLSAPGRLESARLRQLKSSSRSEAAEQLQALSRELVQTAVRTQSALRHGPATDVIVAFAAAKKADLIIMGSQGRTGLSPLLIGSVAERVVRHAFCPVLVVR